ncbi:MAG: PmoA family protein [Verrucomicrobiaceae bacterium]|nr:PmoA family protein [Verrucomicrobiaceae bacterium]
MFLSHRTFLALSLSLSICPAATADISVEKSDAGAVVKVDGQFFTEYVTLSESKPILYPIIGPTGKKMTRDYPMVKDSQNEEHDHPHHRSFWFTHMEVNNWNFWAEKTSFGKKEVNNLGMTKHREFTKLEGGKDKGVIHSVTDWIAGDGKKQLEDERRITFSATPDARIIDFDIDLKATESDVEWGDNKDGTFGLRVASSMDVKHKEAKGEPGRIVNAEGLIDAAAWGKRSNWVDYSGKVEGDHLGVAILDHPASFRHPTPWHVREYGLFCANPFGLQDFDKASAPGTYVQKKGETMKFRFRVIFHKGDEKAADIAKAYEAYSTETK